MRTVAAAFAVAAAVAATGAFAAGDLDAVLGKALFERDWVPAPASTDSADGLGPLFSARGCSGCHAGPALGARFTPAAEGRIAGRGLVVRFADRDGRPDPVYGSMLQNQAIQGMKPEGRIVLSAVPGEARYDFTLSLDRGPLDPVTRMSLRAAPPIAGRAALEAIDESAVLALADPDDRNGDGISGRARMVREDGREVLGRYGWKAANPDLRHQIADAFARDLGLASGLSPLPYGDCTAGEPDCLAAPTGASPRFAGQEISAEMIDLVAAYVRALPTRAPQAARPGRPLFGALGCAACHVPSLPMTGGGSVVAYTDLLLHDMGSGLDDGMGEPGVGSAEWRTAPLMALAGKGGRRYLHDGRAASLDEAVRAHGGEAAAAQAAYASLDAADRQRLIDFLESL
jgi:CxxC motif-containing protein (DUF1111 family)